MPNPLYIWSWRLIPRLGRQKYINDIISASELRSDLSLKKSIGDLKSFAACQVCYVLARRVRKVHDDELTTKTNMKPEKRLWWKWTAARSLTCPSGLLWMFLTAFCLRKYWFESRGCRSMSRSIGHESFQEMRPVLDLKRFMNLKKEWVQTSTCDNEWELISCIY